MSFVDELELAIQSPIVDYHFNFFNGSSAIYQPPTTETPPVTVLPDITFVKDTVEDTQQQYDILKSILPERIARHIGELKGKITTDQWMEITRGE